MATVSDSDADPPDGVEFIREIDGRVTARHVESGVASFGETEAEALRQLADALDSHFGDGETIDDPEAYLKDMGSDVDIGEEGSPRGSNSVARTTFSSREVITTLTKHGYVPVGGKGSHTTLRYENPDTGEVRTVTVPQADPHPDRNAAGYCRSGRGRRVSRFL